MVIKIRFSIFHSRKKTTGINRSKIRKTQENRSKIQIDLECFGKLLEILKLAKNRQILVFKILLGSKSLILGSGFQLLDPSEILKSYDLSI